MRGASPFLVLLALGARPSPAAAFQYRDVAGKVVWRADSGKSVSQVVVYLMPQGQAAQIPPPPAGHLQVRQKNARFDPPLLVVVKGQAVDFVNDDNMDHNVFSFSAAKKFDLGVYPKGESKAVVFDKEGPVLTFCSVHEWMNGVIYVVPNPLYALTDSRGEFKIPRVPPGKYVLKTWSASPLPVSKQLEVKPATATDDKPLYLEVSMGEAAEPARPYRAPAAAPAPAAELAVLSGRVRAEPFVEGKASAAAGGAYSSRATLYIKKFDYEHLANVVVYAEPAGPAPAPAEAGPVSVAVEMSRGEARARPSFAAVSTGGPLVFENRSPKPVKLYSGGTSPAYFSVDLAPGETKRVSLKAQGLYHVFCPDCAGSGDEMAKVFAAGPYFAEAGAGGDYALKLPPGRYKVTAWHERLPVRTETVDVGAGEKKKLDFVLSVKQIPVTP